MNLGLDRNPDYLNFDEEPTLGFGHHDWHVYAVESQTYGATSHLDVEGH